MTGYSFDHDLADLLSDGTPPEQLAPAPLPPPAPSRMRLAGAGRLQPVLWTGAGFFAGAVFWHLIGFWSFVSNVAFNAPDGTTQSAGKSASTLARHNTPPRPAATGEITTGSLPDKTATEIEPANEPHGCIAAARAETGGIVLASCVEAPPSTKSVLAAPKQDRVMLDPNPEQPAPMSSAVPVPLNAITPPAASGSSSHTKSGLSTPPAATNGPASQETWASEVDISIAPEPAVPAPSPPQPGQRIIVEPPPSSR